jgi:hypothetical protein
MADLPAQLNGRQAEVSGHSLERSIGDHLVI